MRSNIFPILNLQSSINLPLFLDLHLANQNSSHFYKSFIFDNLVKSISSIIQFILLLI